MVDNGREVEGDSADGGAPSDRPAAPPAETGGDAAVDEPGGGDGGDAGLVGGGPTTTVSDDGIDEVFEKLRDQAPDLDSHGDRSDADARRSGPAVDDTGDESGVETAASDHAASTNGGEPEPFGSLSGGGPDRTVSGENVDDILERVGDDVDYATFDGATDAPDDVAETAVDPEALLPDANGETPVEAVDDEHTPPESADDLRPDDADDAMIDLLADAADDVGEPDGDDATIVEGAPDLFDGSDADGDSSTAAPEDTAADGETATRVLASQMPPDRESASDATGRAEPDSFAMEFTDEGESSWTADDVGLNDPDDQRIEWSDEAGDDGGDEGAGADTTAADDESSSPDDGGRRSFGVRHVAGVLGWFRSLLARVV